MKNQIKIASFVTTSLLLFVFIVQNWALVSIDFLFWSFGVPRVILVSLLFSSGFLLGVMYCAWHSGEDVS